MRLDEEHGYVEPADDLELGQQVRIVPNDVCLANLADELVLVRDGEIVARWPVERGR